MKAATIEKESQINKTALHSVKDAEKSYDHYLKLMELVEFAEDNDPFATQEKEAPSETPQEKVNQPKKPQTDFSFYKPKKIKKQIKGGVKEKERLKRMKGQSSQTSWKPESYMKMRQEFD